MIERSIAGQSITGRDPSVHPRYGDWGYSLRRYYVDEFYARHVGRLPHGAAVLDLGGKKVGKRGSFDIACYGLAVTSANIEAGCRPDVRCDAVRLPLCSGAFDAVVCSETLLYVQPQPSLAEMHRVLRPGGRLLLCTPFLYPEASSPQDHDHYHLTRTFFADSLVTIGFTNVVIEPQGQFHSVLANMLKMYVNEIANGTVRAGWTKRKALAVLAVWLQRRALRMESRTDIKSNPFYGRFATGFGVVAEKR